MTEWNPNQYVKFINERTRPAVDLADRTGIVSPKNIIDIGCGPGNSTKVLADKFPGSRVVGSDNSRNMLDKARAEYPELEFVFFDAGGDYSVINQKFDLVFSNACLQWIPNHKMLLKNLMTLLNENGVLAVQIPINYNEPIHKIITEITTSEKWRANFTNPRIFYTLTKREYFDILSEISSDFSMWETIYCHRMPSHESIIEWYKGTGLRPYLSVLSQEKAAELEKDVLEEVIKAYPKQMNGEIAFNFPRLFFTAVK